MSESLINLVRSYPILYDVSCKDKLAKNTVWDEIAHKLSMESGAVAKAKWRNVRDSYVKYLKSRMKNDESGQIVKKYTRWPWAQRMQFLNPYISLRSDGGDSNFDTKLKFSLASSSSSHDDNINGDQDDDDKLSNDDHILMQEDDSAENGDPLNFMDNKTIKIEPTHLTFPTSDQTNAHEINKSFTARNFMDPVDLLFSSYAQTMKRFTQKRQVEVKLQLAQIMSKAEMEQIEEQERAEDDNL